MEYEIVTLEKKTAAVLFARTSNLSPDMSAVIGRLWSRFYTEGIHDSVSGRCNAKALRHEPAPLLYL